MKNRLRVSGVAKGQYKKECNVSWLKCKGNEKELEYKIQRAVDLGKVTHTFLSGAKIIRYYNKNFLVDDCEVLTVWTDLSRPSYSVDEKLKDLHKLLFFDEVDLYYRLTKSIVLNR